MPIDEKLADRIRERFADLPNVEEKAMMGGLTFMYNDKMCVGIFRGDLMCRIDPEVYEQVLEKQGRPSSALLRHAPPRSQPSLRSVAPWSSRVVSCLASC